MIKQQQAKLQVVKEEVPDRLILKKCSAMTSAACWLLKFMAACEGESKRKEVCRKIIVAAQSSLEWGDKVIGLNHPPQTLN